MVSLAVLHVEAAAFLGLALLGVVVVDPAPADFVLLVVIAVTLATGRFRARVPTGALLALGGFLGLSLLSAVEVVDHGAAALYLGISMYLTLAALWLSGFVDSRRRARVVAGGYLTAAATSAALGVLGVLAPIPGKELLASERAHALFQDPNVFGPFLVPIALILLEDLLNPRLFGVRALWKVCLVGLLALGVILSYSRGAWLNLALGVVVLLLVLALRRGGGRQRRPRRGPGGARRRGWSWSCWPQPARPASSSNAPSSRSTTPAGSPDRWSASSRPSDIRSGSARVSSRATRRSRRTARTCGRWRSRGFRD